MAVDASVETRGSLARGAAAITVATAISRITGFARVVVVAAALGGTFLVNTYQTANTAPNVVFELVAAGVLTSVFVPTFVEYLVRREREAGWNAASALTSVALVGLIALAIVVALAAPLVMRLLTLGVDPEKLRRQEIALGSTFLRLFAPQIVFYGVGMVMTGALHAYRKFALPAVAPIFNNIVVIVVYLTYAIWRGDRPATIGGITGAETMLLGVGTTMGVVAMTMCLVPQLRRLGWRFRWNFDLSHPAVGKAARVGAWALGYAGGYQAGLIVVLMLANRVQGGVAAYQWAYIFFYVPHALFAAPIFHVLFPAMSEDVAKGERSALAARLRNGISMLGFIQIPTAALMFLTAEPIARLTLDYGVMDEGDAALVGRVIAAFATGLPAYSAFLVLTRAYYALGDPRTPALVNAAAVAVSSAVATGLFFGLSREWAVPGLAFGHSIGFAFGTAILAILLKRREVSIRSRTVDASLVRSLFFSVCAIAAMVLLRDFLPEGTKLETLVTVAAMAAVAGVVYVGGMAAVGSPELVRLLDVVWRTRAQPALVRGRVLQVMGPSAGGTARHVALVVQGLDSVDGLRIDLAGPPDTPVQMPKAVAPVRIPLGPFIGHRRAILTLRKLVREGGYETIHAHGLRAGIDSALAARGLGARVILTVHNLVLPEIAGRWRAVFFKRAEPLAVRLSTCTFAASDQIAAHLKHVAPDSAQKIETLHAPVGDPPSVTRSRDEVREELGLLPHQQMVVTAARLAPQKALDVMLEAIARLPEKVVLVVVGEGPLDRGLQEHARRLGITARVKWLGFRHDVGNYIAAADVLCLSSVWEAVALAAQEAVLLKTAVVSTDVGGMPELIRDGVSGRLVPKGDPEALASALKDVLASEELRVRYAEVALEDLERRFSREAMLTRLAEVYLDSRP